jgi:hypothetical protein
MRLTLNLIGTLQWAQNYVYQYIIQNKRKGQGFE